MMPMAALGSSCPSCDERASIYEQRPISLRDTPPDRSKSHTEPRATSSRERPRRWLSAKEGGLRPQILQPIRHLPPQHRSDRNSRNMERNMRPHSQHSTVPYQHRRQSAQRNSYLRGKVAKHAHLFGLVASRSARVRESLGSLRCIRDSVELPDLRTFIDQPALRRAPAAGPAFKRATHYN